MWTIRIQLRRLTWLALLAIAALVLAPTVSRAAASASPGLGDVCGTSGTPAPLGVHLDHCPYCHLSGAGLVGPAGAPPMPIPSADALEAPAQGASIVARRWFGAPPARAPPGLA